MAANEANEPPADQELPAPPMDSADEELALGTHQDTKQEIHVQENNINNLNCHYI